MNDPDSSAPALSEDDAPEGLAEPRFDRTAEDRYERRGLLGVGGMGHVYAAQDRHLRRQVALKVASTPQLTARLAREALITAQLEHPGIVAVYDAGHDEDGRPWYTMRLIRGRTFEEQLLRCDDLPARLRLLGHFQDACQAVAYAHHMGIVHRDLKPANIMVGEFGETQVADWGLARPVDEAVESWERILTTSAATGVAGTPRYMSPEQARGEPSGCPADVWCLGVVLYEMLAGEKAPAEPGVAPPLEALEGRVAPALLAVARHCLATDPADRYASAGELSEDMDRYLDGRRVQAHDYTPGELLLRLVQAWRAPLGVGALALLALGVVLAVGAQQTRVERASAERNLARALSQQALVALGADRQAEAAVLAAHSLALEPSPVARGVLAATAGPRPERVGRQDLPASCQEEPWLSPAGDSVLCSAEGQLTLWGLSPLERRWQADVHVARPPVWTATAVAASTVGNEVVWISLADGVVIWRESVPAPPTLLAAGDERLWSTSGNVVSVRQPGDSGVESLEICVAQRAALASHGDRLLAGCEDGTFRQYDLEGNVVLASPAPPGVADWSHVVFDGDHVYAGTRAGSVHRMSVETGLWSPGLDGVDGGVLQLAPVSGSPLVLVRGERGATRIWHTERSAWVGGLPARIRRVFDSPQGGSVRVQTDGVETWRLPDLVPSVVQLGSGVSMVAISRSGEHVAYALGSGEVGLVETRDRRIVESWRWQDAVAKVVTFTEDGRLLGAGMGAMGVRMLTVGGGVARLATLPMHNFRRAGTLADGSLWALAYGLFSARIDPASDTLLESMDQVEFFDGSSSPGRTRAAFLGTAGGVWLHDGTTLRKIAEAPDAVAVDVDDAGQVVHAERRQLCFQGRCEDVGARVLDVALAPGGDRVAVGLLSGDILVQDLGTGEHVAVLRGHAKRVSSLEWGPNGDWLVSGSWDGSLRFWDIAAVEAAPGPLIESLERAWGLSLEEALGGEG